MSLKNKAGLEYSTGDRNYQFIVDPDAPIGECFDALVAFTSHVKDLLQKAEEAIKKQEPPAQG